MFLRIATSGLLLCALAAPVAARERPVDPDKKVCRSIVVSGSRINKLVCHTQAEWDSIDESYNQSTAQTFREAH